MKKFSFRKISAIATSALMVCSTMGIAAAANYPAPFVVGGTANVAVVYGTGAGVSQLDEVEAANIQGDLAKGVTGGSISVTGDSYKFEKTSTKFHLGDTITTVDSSDVDDRDLPVLLADGVYIDDDNDEFDYKQSISMAALQLTMFDDDDYKVDSPTVGFEVDDAVEVLNYTLDFTERPLWRDLDATELPIMGKEYYVLSTSSNTSLTLLDSAAETILSEGETATVNGKSVSIEIISGSGSTAEVKLNIDGEVTTSLSELDTYHLEDGSYVGIKDISVQDYAGGIKQVEFSIGNGKLVLADGDEVEMNEEDIDNLIAHITSSGTTELDTIILQWKMDGDSFVTEDSVITMPGFETVSFSFTGLNYPAEETIIVQADGDENLVLSNFPLTETAETINLLYSDGTNFTLIGKDSNNLLATAQDSENLTFTEGTHDYFVVSYETGDDAESYLVRASNFDDSEYVSAYDGNEVDFDYLIDGTWTSLEANAVYDDTISVGSLAEFTIEYISNESEKTVLLSVAGNNHFNMLYSAEGMEVYLPWMNTTAANFTNVTQYSAANACVLGADTLATGQLGWSKTVYYNDTTGTTIENSTTCTSTPATYELIFTEEDKEDDIANGDWINVSVGLDTDDEVYVTGVTTTDNNAEAEIGESDVYREFLYSALATEVLNDQSGDGEKVTLIYHGSEVAANVYISSSSAVIADGTGGSHGVLYVKDTEVSDVKAKNLIIVGGSCINSAAASLVGGAYCGAAWTEATGVGSGQFLIKSYSDSSISDKIALLVAGYNAEDTVNAATYLRTKAVDTSKEYKGTSSTSAELVVTEE